ncbi:MAG TPA: secretin N-terminal domain-containing protein [bacterium]
MKAKSCSSISVGRTARILLAAGLAAVPGSAWAQPQGGAFPGAGGGTESAGPSLRGMEERVSLDLRATEVTDALKYLATKGGLNIAISRNVNGRVNLFLTDVPIRDVFDLILRSNDLAYDMKGNVYNVMTAEEYQQLYGRRFADQREVRTFKLQYAMPEQAFNLLDAMKSDVGRLLVDEESGLVFIMDTPDMLRKMEEALVTLEEGDAVTVFDLRYAKAKDIEERLRDEIDAKNLGFIKADERSNQLVVKTLPARMREVEAIITALDRKTREVLVDAKIVKVNIDDGLSAGIDWQAVFANLKFHGIDSVGDFRNATTGTAPTEVPGLAKIAIPEIKPGSSLGERVKLGELAFGTVSRDGYQLFEYLRSLGETKIISNPRIMVVENQEARIHVGTREAYITTTTTTGQTTTTTAEEVEFIDVGIQLLVTPRINADNFISMRIKPEISSVVRTLVTPSNNQIPIVDTATAETEVVVADGTTVIIGGLSKNEQKHTRRDLPYLGRIPFFGKTLFGWHGKDDERAELVVFITPHIVQGERLVTGDAPALGAGMKPYRDYAPLFDRGSPGGR